MSYKECCKELMSGFSKEQFEYVFSYEYNELDYEFLGFVEQYKALSEIIPKEFIIIDLGCNAAAQMYYFRNHKAYFGVEISDVRCFHQPNAAVFHVSVQEFIKAHLAMFDVNKCFAICNYVPGEETRKLVRETFPNLFVYYPQRFENENTIK